MKQNYSHITIVLDRSGSMNSHRQETIDGFNAFLNKQKGIEGEATMTLVQFDDQYQVDYDFMTLKFVPSLNVHTYVPRGSTALIDAIGRAITTAGNQLNFMSDDVKPSRVIFVIQTDGYENASKEYTQSQIKQMIQHQQEKYNWDFVFLGAGQDAILSASGFGILSKSALTYDKHSSREAFASAANYTSAYRSATSVTAAKSVSFTDTDRSDASTPAESV